MSSGELFSFSKDGETTHPSPTKSSLSSPWVRGFNNDVRLIASPVRPPPGVVEKKSLKTGAVLPFAGVQLKLKKGWKTYWQIPGDAGLPPHFDWSASTNLRDAKVLFPAPKRLKDAGGTAIGYQTEVLFPVILSPIFPEIPIDLRLKLYFGICKDICIPVDVTIALTLPPLGSLAQAAKETFERERALLARYLRKIPKKRAPHEKSLPRLRRITPQLTAKISHLLVDVKFPDNAKNRDLFVLSSSGHYWPLPKAVGHKGTDRIQYKIDLSAKDAQTSLIAETFIFTLVSDKGQSEIHWPFEQCGHPHRSC